MNKNQDWKPIESAPKDGTEILAWRHDCGQFIASYTSADAFPLTHVEIDAMDEATLFAKDWFTQWPHAQRLDGSEAPTMWQPMRADPCATCNGHGMIGGPSYHAPDEGGEPCPDCSALPATPDEPYTVVLDPDPRGVSVGVYQGSSCVYHGAHPIPAGAVADEGAKDERQAFEAWGMAGCEMVDDPQSGRLDIARHCAWEAWKARAAAAPAAGDARGSVDVLPDGSAFALASFPLPANHWLYAEREYAPGAEDPKELPAPILTHAQRDAVVAAIRYAVRGATMCGKEPDFDPDALVQNAVYALCGPFGIAIAASQQGGE